MTLTPAQLRKLLIYNPLTGELTWLKRKNSPEWNGKFAGKKAGYKHGAGYIALGIYNKLYLAHRIVWAIIYNKWPKCFIDHINGDRADNRLCNLREVDHNLNARNNKKRANNTSGICGVSWHKGAKKWFAEVMVSKVKHRLGLFDSLTDAELVVKEFRRQHGFSERHGR